MNQSMADTQMTKHSQNILAPFEINHSSCVCLTDNVPIWKETPSQEMPKCPQSKEIINLTLLLQGI